MSKIFGKITFGQIGDDAIIATDSVAFMRARGSSRWLKLRPAERTKIIRIKTSTFIRRFEHRLDHLPREFNGILRPLRINGRLVSLCWRSSRERSVSGSVVSFAPYLERLISRARTFHLGSHTYSPGPGYSWSCDYKIERLDRYGRLWNLCATDEETGAYQSMGTHSLEEAREYFQGVGFSISQDQWEAMGARFIDDPDQEACA